MGPHPPPPPSDLPPWLRGASRRPRAGRARRGAAAVGLAIVLFGAGAFTGISLWGRRAPAPAPALAAVCPATPACPPGPPTVGHASLLPARLTGGSRKPKPAPASLQSLPDRPALEDGERTQALRAFAEKRGPELRECLDDDEDRGPPLKVGAALEIGANGTVDFVQIIGADGVSKDVRRCYAGHLRRWRFPETLLRGDEKLLVNFVL